MRAAAPIAEVLRLQLLAQMRRGSGVTHIAIVITHDVSVLPLLNQIKLIRIPLGRRRSASIFTVFASGATENLLQRTGLSRLPGAGLRLSSGGPINRNLSVCSKLTPRGVICSQLFQIFLDKLQIRSVFAASLLNGIKLSIQQQMLFKACCRHFAPSAHGSQIDLSHPCGKVAHEDLYN